MNTPTIKGPMRITRFAPTKTAANRIAAEWRDLKFKGVRVAKSGKIPNLYRVVGVAPCLTDFSWWLSIEARWDMRDRKKADFATRVEVSLENVLPGKSARKAGK